MGSYWHVEGPGSRDPRDQPWDMWGTGTFQG